MPKKSQRPALSKGESADLLKALQERFEKNAKRHKGVAWADVEARLGKAPEALWSLSEMEKTGGEPDVVAVDKKTGELTFMDCSPESPKGRRSICFDREALDSRKANKPLTSAHEMADAMGIQILSEDEYRALQKLGVFDQTTSSWVQTPPAIRSRGGALFCDYRFGTVFLYHNGAESYYAARGFRGLLRV